MICAWTEVILYNFVVWTDLCSHVWCSVMQQLFRQQVQPCVLCDEATWQRIAVHFHTERWGGGSPKKGPGLEISQDTRFASKGRFCYLCPHLLPSSVSVTSSVFCLQIDFCACRLRLLGFVSPSLFAVVKPASSCRRWGLEGFWSCASPLCHPLPRWHYASREEEGDRLRWRIAAIVRDGGWLEGDWCRRRLTPLNFTSVS